ncbi:thioredoxin family protein [soil metagenome]
MSPTTVLVVIALIGATTAIGLLWRKRQGTAKRATDDRRTHSPGAPSGGVSAPALVAEDFGSDLRFGSRATLLQFSTEFCSSCPATRTRLSAIADDRDGVAHIDVDLTHRGDLANRYRILQTPTTFVLDGRGAVRARIGGAPRPGVIEAELENIATTERVRSTR